MSTTIDVANAHFGPLVRKPITFVFAEFGTILEAGNPDPKQFTPGPYARLSVFSLKVAALQVSQSTQL